jgi:hypothetical protein
MAKKFPKMPKSLAPGTAVNVKHVEHALGFKARHPVQNIPK